MKRYFIEKVKHEEGDAMLTCSPPIIHPVIVSIRYRSGNDIRWLYCIKIIEFYEFYQSDDDIHSQLLSLEDEELLEKHAISEFDGIPLEDFANAEIDFDDPSGTNDGCRRFSSDPAFNLIRYAMRLSDEWEGEKAKPIIKAAEGHYSDELKFADSEACSEQ